MGLYEDGVSLMAAHINEVHQGTLENLRATSQALQESSLREEDLSQELVTLRERIIFLESQIPPAFTTRIGVYNGPHSDRPDDKTLSTFGALPQVASMYYQPTQAFNPQAEIGRVKRGISPLVTLTLKSGPVSLVDVANGTTAGEAKITQYVNFLRQVSEESEVPVYATLDHEFEVKRNQGEITGVSLSQYAAALSRFIKRCRELAPKVTTLYWFGGSDRASIATVLDAITVRPDVYAADPYRFAHRSVTETLDVSLGDVVKWLRGKLGDVRVGIAEFGTDRAFGDSSNAVWITGLREWCVDNRVEFACLFNRDSSSYKYSIDGLSQAREAFSKELSP